MACGHECNCITYGQHLKGKNIQIAPGLRGLETRRWEKELDLYESARRQGIQPATTTTPDIEYALDRSDAEGKAYDAATGECRDG
ncbi:hypothetical protein [Streptomyces hydrogenans]|uniref:hypothetical protein n=1 Tax=Streptomyces hydrogenans TaxID=1873719 RepID=UPI0035D6CC5F